jgi:hypothetical protein
MLKLFRSLLLISCTLIPCKSTGQTDLSNAVRREYSAVRVPDRSIEIDGKLGDAAWASIPSHGKFTQLRPQPDSPASQRTEIRLAYDNNALYVAARMWDTAADSILHQLVQRDGDGNTDGIMLWFGCYDDNKAAVSFSATPDGVQRDAALTFAGGDLNWNAVWEVECTIDSSGWTAEFALPWSVFRFPKLEGDQQQRWAMNCERTIRRNRATSMWNRMNPNQDNNLSMGGILTGISGITPPPRISLYPYASGYLESYDGESTTSWNMGMDMKLGLGNAFTADITLVPDFGQVQSDNEILNFTPFEIQFQERRQFFTEGVDLFEKTGQFYSRRVGENGQLLNASKITGRTQGGTGVGVLNAISRDEESGALQDFLVAAVDHNLRNGGFVSVQSGHVMRGDSLADDWVGGASFALLDEENRWLVWGTFGANRILTSAAGAGIDGAGATAQTEGETWSWEAAKIAGRLKYSIGQYNESPGYDPNATGYLQAPNEHTSYARVDYGIPEPFQVGRLSFNKMFWNLDVSHSRQIQPSTVTARGIGGRWGVMMENWDFYMLGCEATPWETLDYFAPRLDGLYWREPSNLWVFTNISTDYRKRLALDIFAENDFRSSSAAAANYNDWSSYAVSLSPRFRINDQWMLKYSYLHQVARNERGFTAIRSQDLGQEQSIWARRDVLQREQLIDLEHVVSNRAGFTFRLRHFWSAVDNHAFFSLGSDGYLHTTDLIEVAEDGTSDEDLSLNSWTVDCVYRWVFAPGSELSVVWKNQLYSEGQSLPLSYVDNLEEVLNAPHSNSLSIKLIYFLDYAAFRGVR